MTSQNSELERVKGMLQDLKQGYDVIIQRVNEKRVKHQAKMDEAFRVREEKVTKRFRDQIEDLTYDLKSLRTKYDAMEKSLEISHELNKVKDKKIVFQEQCISSLKERVRHLEDDLDDARRFEQLFGQAKQEIQRLQESVKRERRKSLENSSLLKQRMSRENDLEVGVCLSLSLHTHTHTHAHTHTTNPNTDNEKRDSEKESTRTGKHYS